MTSNGTSKMAIPDRVKNDGESGTFNIGETRTEASSEHVHVVASSLQHFGYWHSREKYLREAMNGCSDGDYAKFLECVERIPHLKEQTDHLKDLINKRRQFLASFAEWQKENTEEPRAGKGRAEDVHDIRPAGLEEGSQHKQHDTDDEWHEIDDKLIEDPRNYDDQAVLNTMSEEERTFCMKIGILQHILIKDQKSLLIIRWNTIVAERRAEAARRDADAAIRDADAAKRRTDAAKWETTHSTSDIAKCQ